MSSTSTQSVNSTNGTASSHDADERQLWDQEALNQERAELEQWATIHTENTVIQNIFVPHDKHCGIWHESPNKTRYASFGDGGTTASVSCYGDLIQMSQYLDVGQSGVFTIEQEKTPEPYQVADRARHLDDLARNMGSKFSFLLIIPDDCCPDEDDPPEVRWVNWRWPRYQYDPPDNDDVKCCYQFMVHGGVVLQQFTLENTTESPIEVGQFDILSKVLIRDLDYLDEWYPFNETPERRKSEWSDRFGPDGYGHIYMHMLPGHDGHCGNECSEHAVAAICTTFVNGSAVKFDPQDENTSIFSKGFMLDGTTSKQNKVEIVLARKLLVIPNFPIDWRNFIISTAAGDINHWLREEEKTLWDKDSDEGVNRCLAKLPIPASENCDADAAGDDGVPRGSNVEESTSDRSDSDINDEAGVEIHEDFELFEMPNRTPKPAKNWNPTDHLEYFAWRHLEHILSVCAVPLLKPGLINGKVETPGPDAYTSIAFTCGDMSGHRISSSASFFAFNFLVDVGRRLQLMKDKTKYTRAMEIRIRDVCSGHVKWLQQVQTTQRVPPIDPSQRPPCNDDILSNEHVIQIGCFAANYWVTGKFMRQDSRTWQPQNRMTDTAFQILKLAEYAKLVPLLEVDRRLLARNLMQGVYVPWLTELHRLDIRKTFSWPHSNLNGVIKFRLSDHFWIWKALECLDTEVTKIRLPSDRPSNRGRENAREIPDEHKKWLLKLYPCADEGDSEGDSTESGALEKAIRKFLENTKRLSPGNLQRTMLQRFTVANDAFKQPIRMLAVTRSAMDMRFLFHGRDAALFSNDGNDFFIPGSPVMELWKSTIDAQLHHEENIYTESNNTLRYALGIATGVRGYTLNNTRDASDMVKKSVNVLIGASGSDAFFPGYLDEEGTGPAIFADEVYRDRFYHADFEINYILLSSASKIGGLSIRKCTRSPAAEIHGGDRSPTATLLTGHRQSSQSKKPTKATARGANVPTTSERHKTIHSVDIRPTVVMKKSLPFTNAIPATDVNYIGDEWLYRYPEFLRGPLERGPLENEQCRADEVCDVVASPPQTFASLFRDKSDKANLEDNLPSIKVENLTESIALYVLDIRKRKQHFSNTRKIEDKAQMRFIDNLEMQLIKTSEKEPSDTSQMKLIDKAKVVCDILSIPRTAWTAKKRIISMPFTNPVTAFACCAFSPEREKHELRRFFKLHGSYSKEVLDEASMVRNEWQTELHLSFYFLVDNGNYTGAEVELFRQDNISFSVFRHSRLKLGRASMSFRFDGDFFDRYWTCHFIEHIPNVSGEGWDHSFDEKKINLEKEKKWSQRKVLELYFLLRILRKMNTESSIFYNKIREMLAIGKGSLGFASSKVRGSMDDLQQFENILDLVEEDLMANLATIRDKWSCREADRGGEKPRWTRNDEAKYRTAINKFCVKVERATGKLQANHDSIRKLKEFLATTRKNRIEAMEHEANERDRESAERDRLRAERDSLRDADIRYLTYVTVIFQPLGFAASFFSMGGPPESALIVSLVEFSAAAFAVTILLIWSYRAVASRLDYGSALEKLSARNKSVEQYLRSKSAFKNNRISIQLVIHFVGGITRKIARVVLATLSWCWLSVYTQQITVRHREDKKGGPHV